MCFAVSHEGAGYAFVAADTRTMPSHEPPIDCGGKVVRLRGGWAAAGGRTRTVLALARLLRVDACDVAAVHRTIVAAAAGQPVHIFTATDGRDQPAAAVLRAEGGYWLGSRGPMPVSVPPDLRENGIDADHWGPDGPFCRDMAEARNLEDGVRRAARWLCWIADRSGQVSRELRVGAVVRDAGWTHSLWLAAPADDVAEMALEDIAGLFGPPPAEPGDPGQLLPLFSAARLAVAPPGTSTPQWLAEVEQIVKGDFVHGHA